MAEPETLPVAAARAGDAGAWRVLFQRFQLPLYAYVFDLTRHAETSLDIVQETFIRAARYLHTLRDDAKFGSWLFGIAHQECVHHWRRAQREQPWDDNLPEPTATDDPGPPAALIAAEDEAKFRHLLDQLPPAHRAVLVLHFLEDFSLEEITHVTGAPLGTVKSRMHHAKRNFRQLWEEHR